MYPRKEIAEGEAGIRAVVAKMAEKDYTVRPPWWQRLGRKICGAFMRRKDDSVEGFTRWHD